MSDYIGWDLLYKVSENDINKKQDVLVLAIHYLLIKSGYRCIGLGDHKALAGNEETTETLPSGWSNENSYALRYVKDSELFVLRGTPNDDSTVFNFLRVSTLAVSSIVLVAETEVGSLKGGLEEVLPKAELTLGRLKKELIEAEGVRKESAAKDTGTQTIPGALAGPSHPLAGICRHPPTRSPSPSTVPRLEPFINPDWVDPPRDPLRVGGADLDPLGRGGRMGGGMIFDPFSGGIPDPDAGLPGPPLPRGSIPPGARFDPFGPPDLERMGGRGRGRGGFGPDPDHFQPPGFGDMFM